MRRGQRGSSLLEVLIVVVLLAVLIPALMAGFTAAYVTIKDARMLEIAKHIATLKVEQALSGIAAAESETAFPGLPGFSTTVSTNQIWSGEPHAQALEITVVVKYAFLNGTREYRMVVVQYPQPLPQPAG